MRYQLSSELVSRGEERSGRSRIPHHLHTRRHAAAVLSEEEIETVELVDSHGRLKGP